MTGALSAISLKTRIEKDSKYVFVCGQYFSSTNTNTKNLLAVADWVANLKQRGHFAEAELAWMLDGLSAEKIAILSGLAKNAAGYKSDYETCCSKLREMGILSEPLFWGEKGSVSLSKVLEKISVCDAYGQYLQRLSDYCRTLKSLEEMGLSGLVDFVQSGKLNLDECVPAYQFYLFDSMSKELIRNDKKLAGFNRIQHDSTIQRFAQLDRELMEYARKRIASIIATRSVPQGNKAGYVKDHTELALLEREVQKQRRHIPIRQLMKRAGLALQALKPCFMMSPLSVVDSHIIPAQVF